MFHVLEFHAYLLGCGRIRTFLAARPCGLVLFDYVSVRGVVRVFGERSLPQVYQPVSAHGGWRCGSLLELCGGRVVRHVGCVDRVVDMV